MVRSLSMSTRPRSNLVNVLLKLLDPRLAAGCHNHQSSYQPRLLAERGNKLRKSLNTHHQPYYPPLLPVVRWNRLRRSRNLKPHSRFRSRHHQPYYPLCHLVGGEKPLRRSPNLNPHSRFLGPHLQPHHKSPDPRKNYPAPTHLAKSNCIHRHRWNMSTLRPHLILKAALEKVV